jgi:hypothetical protein
MAQMLEAVLVEASQTGLVKRQDSECARTMLQSEVEIEQEPVGLRPVPAPNPILNQQS